MKQQKDQKAPKPAKKQPPKKQPKPKTNAKSKKVKHSEAEQKENTKQNQDSKEQIKEETKTASSSTTNIDISKFSSIPINEKPVLPSNPIDSYLALDLSSSSYNPTSPSNPFKKGQDTPFAFICAALQSIEKISGAASRKKMILILSNLFWTIFTHKQVQVISALYFLLVKLCPDFVILETGCGQDVLTKVMCKACSVNNAQLKKHISKQGDYGNVISTNYNSMNNIGTFFKNASPSKPADKDLKILTLNQVFRYLY